MASQLSKTLTHKKEGVNMAVDIKKMVEAICSLTVLELSKLVKALRDKFGLRTSDTNEAEDPDSDRVNGRATENSNESDKSNSDSTPIEPEDKSSDEPIVDVKDVEDGMSKFRHVILNLQKSQMNLKRNQNQFLILHLYQTRVHHLKFVILRL